MEEGFILFKDRADAGRQLAEALPTLDPAKTVVVAMPRGGVPVAVEICRARQVPLDLVFVRKIGAPPQPEVAVGAVADGANPHVFVNQRIASSFGLTEAEVHAMGNALLSEIARRKKRYLGGRKSKNLKGKTLVVVDDGVATGATLRIGLEALQGSGAARIIVALPVAPASSLHLFEPFADEICCLQTPRSFMAVGAYYRSFAQVDDEEVVAAMEEYA